MDAERGEVSFNFMASSLSLLVLKKADAEVRRREGWLLCVTTAGSENSCRGAELGLGAALSG